MWCKGCQDHSVSYRRTSKTLNLYSGIHYTQWLRPFDLTNFYKYILFVRSNLEEQHIRTNCMGELTADM